MTVATRQADLITACVLCWPGRQWSNVVQSWGLVVQQSWYHPTAAPVICASAVGLLQSFPDIVEDQKNDMCGGSSSIAAIQETLKNISSILFLLFTSLCKMVGFILPTLFTNFHHSILPSYGCMA